MLCGWFFDGSDCLLDGSRTLCGWELGDIWLRMALEGCELMGLRVSISNCLVLVLCLGFNSRVGIFRTLS